MSCADIGESLSQRSRVTYRGLVPTVETVGLRLSVELKTRLRDSKVPWTIFQHLELHSNFIARFSSIGETCAMPDFVGITLRRILARAAVLHCRVSYCNFSDVMYSTVIRKWCLNAAASRFKILSVTSDALGGSNYVALRHLVRQP